MDSHPLQLFPSNTDAITFLASGTLTDDELQLLANVMRDQLSEEGYPIRRFEHAELQMALADAIGCDAEPDVTDDIDDFLSSRLGPA